MNNTRRTPFNISLIGIFLLFAALSTQLSCNTDDPKCDGIVANPTSVIAQGNGSIAIKIIGDKLFAPETSEYSIVMKAEQVKAGPDDPITDLVASDFSLLDNDDPASDFPKVQDLIPTEDSYNQYILILVDVSDALVHSDSIEFTRQHLTSMVDSLLSTSNRVLKNTKIGISYFDGDVGIRELTNFTDDAATLKSDIGTLSDALRNDNSRNLNGAILEATSKLNREIRNSFSWSSSGAIIILSDGSDQANYFNEQEVIDSLSLVAVQVKNPVQIYAVEFTDKFKTPFLSQIGFNGGSYVVPKIHNISQTERLRNDLLNHSNSYYYISYCTPRRNGNAELNYTINYGGQTANLFATLDADCIENDCL